MAYVPAKTWGAGEQLTAADAQSNLDGLKIYTQQTDTAGYITGQLVETQHIVRPFIDTIRNASDSVSGFYCSQTSTGLFASGSFMSRYEADEGQKMGIPQTSIIIPAARACTIFYQLWAAAESRTDQLGMSESERSTLERQLLHPISSAQREGQSELLEAMSIQDVGAANTARQMQALSSVAGEQKAQAMDQVQEAERFREAQQRADISALEAQRRARRVGMATAGIGAAADLAGVAVQQQKAKLDAANQKAMMQLLQANQESADQSTQYLDEATANQLLMLKLLQTEVK
jgi:hypothetical protein